ncbi:hypothetical protein MD484_g2522, partial [Candolleomyces efflorescens]
MADRRDLHGNDGRPDNSGSILVSFHHRQLSSAGVLALEYMSFLKRSWAPTGKSLARAISTVHRGAAFEERALRLLKDNFSMSLRRVGGRGDGGIDLLGWWWLPCHSLAEPGHLHGHGTHQDLGRRRRFRIVGQCKAEKKKMGPNYVRELEGVMYRLTASARLYGDSAVADVEPTHQGATDASSSSSEGVFHSERDILAADEPTVAVLVSQSPFTKATLLRAQSSPIPFLLLHLPTKPDAFSSTSTGPSSPPASSADSEPVAAAIWNKALGGSQGLLQGQMEVRENVLVYGLMIETGANRPCPVSQPMPGERAFHNYILLTSSSESSTIASGTSGEQPQIGRAQVQGVLDFGVKSPWLNNETRRDSGLELAR